MDRIPVGARFSASVQAAPAAHPASYTMGTGFFPGVKRPGRDVEHTPPSSAEVEEGVELYFCTLSGPSWPVIGRTLPLPLSVCTNGLHFNWHVTLVQQKNSLKMMH